MSRGGKPRRPVKKQRTSAESATPGVMEEAASGYVETQVAGQDAQGVPTALSVEQDIPSTQPLLEAYEKARMTSISASAVGPAGFTMGSSATGIPPPTSGKPVSGTPRLSGEGNQFRRPWTKEEGPSSLSIHD